MPCSTAKAVMQAFCEKHTKKIHGVLSCCDRISFRGYLPITSGASSASLRLPEMAQFLQSEQVNCGNLKQFLLETSERVKGHAQRMAAAAGRPYMYLPGAGVRMEQQARELAEYDGISEGLICIFAKVEPCKSFSFEYSRGDFSVKSATRKLDAAGIAYKQCDNAFVWIEDIKRAQRFSDRMSSVDWPPILNAPARRVNPLMGTLLGRRCSAFWGGDGDQRSHGIQGSQAGRPCRPSRPRLYQPGHPATAQAQLTAGAEAPDRAAALCQDLPLVPPPACPWSDRQDSPIPALAIDQARSARHVQRHPSQRSDIP